VKLLLLTLGLAAATAAAGPSLAAGTGPTSPMTPAAAALSHLSGPAFDVGVMRALIPVDEEAVEMAMTATLYADHADLLHWNQAVVERKNDQVRKMLGWLQEAGAAPAERRAGVATASVKKLRTLRGPALERAYISLMTNQLEQSAALERLAVTKADRQSLRDFARDSLRMDTQDAGTLHSWMKQWY
jgi:uncharacterized protein (DUF305 family)